MSDTNLECNDVEKLLQSHRKQRKELQSKIQALKKNVTKGDRKKKKEVDEEILNLEREFEKKCSLELESLKSNQKLTDNQNTSESSVSDNQNAPESIVPDNVFDDKNSEEKPKSNKAQKRREKKEMANIEREKQIELQEIENKKGSEFIELNNINEKLKLKNLRINEVRSDGNCMYYSISDQLERILSIHKTCQELREMACNYMLENREEFEPYLEFDNTVNTYEDYCENIKNETVWGGQLELKALSDVLNVVIEVIQSEGSEIIIGNQSNTSSLIITYHRKMFGSGEHYNSTMAIENLNEFE